MTKQSSIEWLIDQMFKQGYFDGNKPFSFTNLDHLQHEAQQMHKEEIEDAYGDGLNAYRVDFCNRDEYYQKTYGGQK
jgi:hypothetical protein